MVSDIMSLEVLPKLTHTHYIHPRLCDDGELLEAAGHAELDAAEIFDLLVLPPLQRRMLVSRAGVPANIHRL